MAKRWFWEKGLDETDTPYAIMFLEDGEDRAMTYCFAHTQKDASFIMDAIIWKEAMESSLAFSIPERRKSTPKKRPVNKKSSRVKARRSS